MKKAVIWQCFKSTIFLLTFSSLSWLTTTTWTCSCSCVSRRSCTTRCWSSAASTESTRSDDSSETRVSTWPTIQVRIETSTWFNKLIRSLLHIYWSINLMAILSKIRLNWKNTVFVSYLSKLLHLTVIFGLPEVNSLSVFQSSQLASFTWPTPTTTTWSTWPRRCWLVWSRASSESIRWDSI